jgi:type I restriction enzyme S subunit
MVPHWKLPLGWTWCAVGDVGSAALGRQLPRSDEIDAVPLPYLRVANVQDDDLSLDNLKYMKLPVHEQQRYLVRPNDIVLCEGQSRELVGRCAIYRGELDRVLYQNTVIRFTPELGMDPEYILAVFRTFQREGIFSSVARSTTNLAHLGLARFRHLAFPLPPSDVQAALGASVRSAQDAMDYLSACIRGAVEHCAIIN